MKMKSIETGQSTLKLDNLSRKSTQEDYISTKPKEVKNLEQAAERPEKEHSMSQIPITENTKLLDVLAEEFEDQGLT